MQGVKPQAAKRPLYEAVIKKEAENPDWTLQQLGDHFGLTRERVRQILLIMRGDKSRRRKRHTREQLALLAETHQTLEELTAALGTTPNHIRTLYRRKGLQAPPAAARVQSHKQRAEFARLIEKGYTVMEAAIELGVTLGMASHWKETLNLKTKSRRATMSFRPTVKMSDEDLLWILRDWLDAQDQTSSAAYILWREKLPEHERAWYPTHCTFYKRFGSWVRARNLARALSEERAS